MTGIIRRIRIDGTGTSMFKLFSTRCGADQPHVGEPASHFSFLQDPGFFNAAILHFLDDR